MNGLSQAARFILNFFLNDPPLASFLFEGDCNLKGAPMDEIETEKLLFFLHSFELHIRYARNWAENYSK